MDIIAPFWTDLNNRESGNITYQQYTSGDVLQTATKDIRSYFPSVTFTASWVFVATWDRVAYYSNRGTENTFQVVLISDSKLAFILMNYGDIAPSSSPILSQPSSQVQIGYDTISSTHYGSLRTCYPNNIIDIVNLKTSSNVNIQGRWAFLTTLQSTSFSCTNTPRLPEPQPDHVLGVRLKVSSFEDLNEEQIEEQILKPFGDLLSQHGIDVSGLRLRRIYKTEP
ncbi:sushi, nidogen and EGF-like domain-containing protein 1 [Clupea harengus]|uniref:Sushi, nidogen and EGF-like domain-containing protein 1 n=1 Tax=Clupea harengus TaxID=7950 RepID=A0A6P8FYQ9_CLUHA|nr:sushi, nidogen and EGF-like domain-containing protein 1 [Clupea harengus]